MKSKKKHTNQDFEVVDGIGKYMDDDIQRIIEEYSGSRDAGRKTKEQENKDAIVL